VRSRLDGRLLTCPASCGSTSESISHPPDSRIARAITAHRTVNTRALAAIRCGSGFRDGHAHDHGVAMRIGFSGRTTLRGITIPGRGRGFREGQVFEMDSPSPRIHVAGLRKVRRLSNATWSAVGAIAEQFEHHAITRSTICVGVSPRISRHRAMTINPLLGPKSRTDHCLQ
jgi:hypothetical protein